jgi:TRAP-type C4-dicarboxylate transport system substrate-binding protein
MENENQMNTWRDLGASPTVVAFTELYTALQQGLVEGQDNSIDVTYVNKFMEQTPYVTKTNHLSGASVFTMSKAFLDSLTEEQRQIINEAWQYMYDNKPDIIAQQDEYQRLVETENNVTVYEFTNDDKDYCRAQCDDVWANIEKNVSAEVFAGFNQAIANARN